MVFIEHNSLKPDIFLSPYLFHVFQDSCFSGFRFFRVQVFQSPGFSGSRFFRVQVFLGPGFPGSSFFRVRVQVLEVAYFQNTFSKEHLWRADSKYLDVVQNIPLVRFLII